jgi:hypothetical protein
LGVLLALDYDRMIEKTFYGFSLVYCAGATQAYPFGKQAVSGEWGNFGRPMKAFH